MVQVFHISNKKQNKTKQNSERGGEKGKEIKRRKGRRIYAGSSHSPETEPPARFGLFVLGNKASKLSPEKELWKHMLNLSTKQEGYGKEGKEMGWREE
jgi:hypothetical protein